MSLFDYTQLPLPDYASNQGLRGHAPSNRDEHARGYVEGAWGAHYRLRCCFCPFDCAGARTADMQLHIFERHWQKQAVATAPVTREPLATLYTGDGKRVTEMPVAAEPPPMPRMQPQALMEIFPQDADALLKAVVADLVREGKIDAPIED